MYRSIRRAPSKSPGVRGEPPAWRIACSGACAITRRLRETGTISRGSADAALQLLRIDELGLDDMDRGIVDTIVTKFSGGPVGLSSLAVAIGEEAKTLEEVHEPYLIQMGFLKRTSQGRVATPLAYKHLGLELSRPDQDRLF